MLKTYTLPIATPEYVVPDYDHLLVSDLNKSTFRLKCNTFSENVY